MRQRRSRERNVGAIVVLAMVAAAESGLAQAAAESRLENLHFAFANYLGSGIYSVDDRTVQVYHFPVTIELRDAVAHAWGISLCIPPMIGIYDLDGTDIVGVGLVDRMATVGLVPRLNFIRGVGDHWSVTPFVDFGAAKNLDGGDAVWVRGAGVVVEAVYAMPRYELRPLIRFVAAHHTGTVGLFGNDLVKLEPGLEARFPLPIRARGKQVDLGLFGKHYAYFNELEIHDPEEMPVDFTAQWEIGVTVGTRPALELLGVPLPRLGISFRFGDEIAAVRVVFGGPL